MTKKYYYILLAYTSILPSLSYAEDISLCKGVWTSKPCSESAEKKFEAVNKPVEEKQEVPTLAIEENTSSDSLEEEKKATSKNELILHDLKMKALDIKEKYGSNYDLRMLESFCAEDKLDTIECENKLTEEVSSLRDFELRLKEIALEEEKLKREEESSLKNTTVNQGNTSFTQVQQTVQTNTVVGAGTIQNNPTTLIKKHVEIIPKIEPRPSPKSEIIKSVNNVIKEASLTR